ncbi:hypothetical protein Hanom_Chr04g00374811 [Helianthus anomalus]
MGSGRNGFRVGTGFGSGWFKMFFLKRLYIKGQFCSFFKEIIHQGAILFGSKRHWSKRHASKRFASKRFGSKRYWLKRYGSKRFDSKRYCSKRYGLKRYCLNPHPTWTITTQPTSPYPCL